MDRIDTEKIKEVLRTMDYGQNVDSTAKADEWLRTVNITDQSGEIGDILQKMKKELWCPTNQDKKSVLSNFAQEIAKNLDIICQIEIQSRGILSKDTKKYLPLLVNYIEFYSNFCVKSEAYYNKECNRDPRVVVAIFNDDNPLWMLGLAVGPALAAGCSVVLQTETKLAAATKFILKLAEKVGIPEHALTVIPSVEGNIQTYLDNHNVDILCLYVDLFDSKNQGVNKRLITVLHFSSYMTPMIVFDSCDIDSAVESAVDGAWGYQGMQPWAINQILVQENIFQKFTAKLKHKLSTIKIGNGNNKLADISFPSNPAVCTKLKQAVEKAKASGVEVFQTQANSMNFTPTIFVGLQIETNNVIKAPEKTGAVTLLSFRSIDEAVNLANNSRQGFGASVWTENIGLANEVAEKLEVNNVWINGHGLISVAAPLVPMKDSGNAYFGGSGGFYEYFKLASSEVTSNQITRPSNLDNNVINAIKSAKPAVISWRKTTYLDRLKSLSAVWNHIKKINEASTDPYLLKCINEFGETLDLVMFQQVNYSVSSPYPGYSLSVTKKSKGVLVMNLGKVFQEADTKLIVSAILEGNALVMLMKSLCSASPFHKIMDKMYVEMGKKLPSGLISILPYSNEAEMTAISHKAVNGYYNVSSCEDTLVASLPLTESRIFCDNFMKWEDIANKVTVTKNLWCNIGQSITCSL